MTRALGLVGTIALATALFGGAADAQTIKIGVNEPLTGAFASQSDEAWTVTEINTVGFGETT